MDIRADKDTTDLEENQNLISTADDDKTLTINSEKNKDRYMIMTLTIATIILLLYCIMVEKNIMGKMIANLNDYLTNLYKRNSFSVLAIIFLMVIINYLLILPLHTMINILAAFIIENPLKSWLMLIIFSLIASSLVFIICKYIFNDYLTKKFQGNNLYDILKEESNIAPYKTAFITRLIFIPSGFKEYILSLTGNPYSSFIISGFFIHGFFILQAVLIATGIRDIQEYMTKKKVWNEKNMSEKVSFILLLISTVFMVCILIAVGYWGTMKIKEKNNRKYEQIDIEVN